MRPSLPRAGSPASPDVKRAADAGAAAVLVGTSLLQSGDPAAAAAKLVRNAPRRTPAPSLPHPHRPWVKACGTRTEAAVRAAVAADADFIGFVLDPRSPRAVSVERAAALMNGLAGPTPVLVFRDPTGDDVASGARGDRRDRLPACGSRGAAELAVRHRSASADRHRGHPRTDLGALGALRCRGLGGGGCDAPAAGRRRPRGRRRIRVRSADRTRAPARPDRTGRPGRRPPARERRGLRALGAPLAGRRRQRARARRRERSGTHRRVRAKRPAGAGRRGSGGPRRTLRPLRRTVRPGNPDPGARGPRAQRGTPRGAMRATAPSCAGFIATSSADRPRSFRFRRRRWRRAADGAHRSGSSERTSPTPARTRSTTRSASRCWRGEWASRA